MNFYLLFFLIGPLTLEIATIVWMNNISKRIGDEARSRGIDTNFGSGTYWLWAVLGTLILVGPFIYLHKLCKTMNEICADENSKNAPAI